MAKTYKFNLTSPYYDCKIKRKRGKVMDKIKSCMSFCIEHQNKLKIAAVIMILITAVLFFAGKGENDTIQIDQETPLEEVSENNEESQKKQGKIFVDIGGEVVKPGVYQVKDGARVYEIVEKAGGLTDKADTTNINQAEIAADGQKIIIPSIEESTGQENSGAPAVAGVAGLININSANAATLEEIPGVGPSTAEKIISYRESNGRFKKKEDLKNVSGIGEKTFEKLKDKITV